MQSDPRVVALEEQLRALNGTVEELNFQILQLQEQIRKMQEDNEFRFQELEKKSDARGGKGNRTVAERPLKEGDAGADVDAGANQADAGSPASVEDIIVNDGGSAAPAGQGEPPKNFGILKVDKDGNVVDAGAPPAAAEAPTAPGADGTVVAALPPTADPEELYRNAYQFILSGDYGTAESGFRDHIAVSRRIRARPMRISGWANRCSDRRSIATRPRCSSTPTRTIRRPRRRRTCC